MRPVSSYLHTLDGRLRVKIPDIKRSPAKAHAVQTQLGTLAGIDEASANPVTGNVLVLYDPGVTAVPEILEALWAWGYLRETRPPVGAAGRLDESWGTVVLRATTELAIQRLITALL